MTDQEETDEDERDQNTRVRDYILENIETDLKYQPKLATHGKNPDTRYPAIWFAEAAFHVNNAPIPILDGELPGFKPTDGHECETLLLPSSPFWIRLMLTLVIADELIVLKRSVLIDPDFMYDRDFDAHFDPDNSPDYFAETDAKFLIHDSDCFPRLAAELAKYGIKFEPPPLPFADGP